MMLMLEVTPRAERDIKEAFAFLAENNLDTAIDFYHAVYDSLARLQQFPAIGTAKKYRKSKLKNLRMWFVQSYEKYLIFYQVTDESVKVVRLIHAAQDPTRLFSED